MTDPQTHTDPREERINEAVAAYLDAARAGAAPEREAFLSRFPDVAEELASFLGDQESFARLASPLGPTPLPRRAAEQSLQMQESQHDMPTLAPTEAAASLAAGRTFGDYDLLEEIARGGMGVVFKARQRILNRVVALKMILAGQLASAADVQRFRTEAQAAAALDHPNIVPIYEVGEHDGQPYFSMKLIEGGPLTQHLARFAQDPRAAARLLTTVARAVHYAHQRGILHRDLKPANILLADCTPHITDFGLAKRVEAAGGAAGPTQTGAIVGTPSYMAPEQAAGGKNLSTAADVYSLGAILYELLTGQPPFRAETPLETVLQVLERDPARPRTLRPEVDPDLETICLKCLEKEPERRYGTAEDLAADLERWLRGEPIQARPCGRWERARKWARRRPAAAMLTAVSACSFVVFLVLAGILWLNAEERAQAVQDLGAARQEQALARKDADDQRHLADDKRREFEQVQKQVEQARQDAQASRDRARRTVYAADMLFAHAAWESENVPRMLRLLESHSPPPGQEDPRGFEWHYLWRLAHRDRLTLTAYRPDKQAATSNSLHNPILLALSPDGKSLATASVAREIKLWDLAGGKEKTALPGPGESVASLTFTPEGKSLTLVTFRKREGDRFAFNLEAVEQATSDKWKPSLQPLTDLFAVRRLVLDDRKAAPAEKFRPSQLGRPLSLLFSGPDGLKGMVSGIIPLRGELFSPICLAASRDGKTLAVGGIVTPFPFQPLVQEQEGGVLLWDLTTDEPKAVLKGHVGPAMAIAFSPDGKTLASAGFDRTIRLWDVSTGKQRTTTLQSLAALAATLEFSPDGKLLVSGSPDAVIKLWDPSTGQERGVLRGHVNAISSLAFTADGKTLTSASLDGTVKVWDMPPPPEPLALPGHTMAVKALALLPDGKRLAVIDRVGTFKLWDLATGKELSTHADRMRTVREAVLSPDGKTAALVSLVDEKIRLYDPSTEQLRLTLKGHTKAPRCLAFSPDGQTLATGGDDNVVKLWHVATGEEQATLAGHKEPVLSLAFTRDGRTLAAGCGQWLKRDIPVEVKVWDLVTRQPRTTFAIPAGSVRALAFSPDGRRLASASGDTIQLWDLTTGKESVTVHDYSHDIVALAFSPDGKRLASGFGMTELGKGGGVKLWDPIIGREVLSLGGPNDSVAVLAFSSDGHYLFSGSGESLETLFTNKPRAEVKVWNATLAEVPARGHAQPRK
jgi:WD40 repeat protein/tRNA A-37 threonylcarbamoyl transferase component Bud32